VRFPSPRLVSLGLVGYNTWCPVARQWRGGLVIPTRALCFAPRSVQPSQPKRLLRRSRRLRRAGSQSRKGGHDQGVRRTESWSSFGLTRPPAACRDLGLSVLWGTLLRLGRRYLISTRYFVTSWTSISSLNEKVMYLASSAANSTSASDRPISRPSRFIALAISVPLNGLAASR